MILQKQHLLLIFVLLLAVFFRFYQLNLIPPGLYPDEAVNGMDALREEANVFYKHNNGREGLYINLLGLSLRVFGVYPWSLRLVSALVGVLTVGGLYLLAQELFNRRVGLLAAFLLSVSFWHINFSRIAFRGILVPFCLVFFLYFLYRFQRTRKILALVGSAVFFGLGFHTYLAWRFMVFFLPFLVPFKIKKLILFLGVAFIVALPLGLYFLQEPSDFIGRAGGVSIFATDNWLKSGGESTLKTLGMFNIKGDGNWRHNYAGSPLLFWPVGILFLIGIIIFVREKRLALLFLFILMLLPALLTYEGVPHALRTIGVIPLVYLFAGRALERLRLPLPLLLVFLILITGLQFNKYFLDWGKREEVKDAFSQDLVDLGHYLIGREAYVKMNRGGVLVEGIPVASQTIEFITYQKAKIHYVQTLEEVPPEYSCIHFPAAEVCERNSK